ncbi:MAG: DUF192 domain-containing protein [Acidobacteriota bacterium]
MKNSSSALGAAWALLFLACGAASKPSPTPAATPEAVSGPRVVMPSGAVYTLEVARTPEEQAQGLMYREALAPRTGMIFLFTDGGAHRFWMKNTMIPLDILWLDAGGKVLFVSANTPPCKSDPCPTYGPDAPAPIVLEISGGMASREGARPGASLKLFDVSP